MQNDAALLHVGLPSSRDRRPTWEQVQNDLLAKVLTAPPTDDVPIPSEPVVIVDRETKISRAKGLLNVLEAHISRLRPLVRQNPNAACLMRAAADGDWKRLASLGIDVERAWLDDIVMAMVTHAPFVEIETVGPYAAHHVDPYGRFDVTPDNLPNDERAGILLGAIFRDVTQDCPNVRIVALLDDLNDDIGGKTFDIEERDRYIVSMSGIFYESGVLRHGDVPGRDFLLLRESANEAHVDELIGRLRSSGTGSVEVVDDGTVVFLPSEALIRRLALDSRSRVRELRRKGIVIRKAGRPTCQALDAAGFLAADSLNERILHVVMLDKRFDSQQDKTYALLRALGIVRQDTHHNVFYDGPNLQPEAVALVICELLVRELQRLIVVSGRHDDWDAFDVDEHRDRWCGTNIRPHDQRVVELVVEQLAALELSPVGAVADIGSGSSLVPALLSAPHVATDGSITVFEYAEQNRGALKAGLEQIRADREQSPWLKFERLMADRSPRYENIIDRLPDLCRVEPGSLFELPRGAYDMVSSFFVAESITTSRREFRVALRALLGAVRSGGVLVAGHMVASLGYSAGAGAVCPPLRLSRRDIEEAYRDIDVDFSLFIAGNDEARDGSEAVAVVIARP